MIKRKVAYNALAGFLLQLMQITMGFIVPRLIMEAYGSSVNGLIASITQFLSYIALMDAGVSAVVRAKLYKPLVHSDYNDVQLIVNAAREFYKKIAYVFLVYMAVVTILLPLRVLAEFSFLYTASLILIVGVATFAEYFFGISYQVLLDADQRKYIYYIIQAFAIFLNILLSAVLIRNGLSIHFVKLITSIVFIIRPLVVSTYCNKRYGFDKNNKNTVIVENQWTGMAHHLAYFLHTHTDVVLLTLFKSPLTVSVYSVYNMIVMGVVNVINLTTGGIEAAFGTINAAHNGEKLREGFNITLWVVFTMTTIMFSTAYLTIIPFVKVYTKGINDVSYIDRPAAVILILAEGMYCIRMPLQAIIMATGKIKETMRGAVIEVVINIAISLMFVWNYGIAGVAIGTLCAMTFRTIDYLKFISSNIVFGCVYSFLKRFIVMIIATIGIVITYRFLPSVAVHDYLSWGIQTLIVVISATVIVLGLNSFFFMDEAKKIWNMIRELAHPQRRD